MRRNDRVLHVAGWQGYWRRVRNQQSRPRVWQRRNSWWTAEETAAAAELECERLVHSISIGCSRPVALFGVRQRTILRAPPSHTLT